MPEKRRHRSPTEKVRQLKRHLIDRVPISTICDELSIQPTQFYQWQKQFFENGEAAFKSTRTEHQAAERRQQQITKLEDKLRKKDEIIALVTEEHLQLKKELGET